MNSLKKEKRRPWELSWEWDATCAILSKKERFFLGILEGESLCTFLPLLLYLQSLVPVLTDDRIYSRYRYILSTYAEGGGDPIVEDALDVGKPWGNGSSGKEVESYPREISSPCNVMEDTEDKLEDMPTVLSYCADPCLWAFIKSYFKNIIS